MQHLVNAIHPDLLHKIDPQFAEIYTKNQAPKLRADQVTYDEYNADRSRYTFSIAQGPNPEVGSVTVYEVKVHEPEGKIYVQVFVPTQEAVERAGSRRSNGNLPAHVDYHGGGFVIGSLESDAPWCRQVCQALGCIILNVDYRMAPDFPHPVPIMDAWVALKWTFAEAPSLGIDTSRVSVGGLSAGGNFAAVLALLARDEPGMPDLVLQLLIVPAVDARFIPIEGSCDPKVVPYESYVTCENAPCLPLQRLRWFYNLWLGTDVEERKMKANHFLASPILATSHANLAPASIHIAEVDTLHSEGVAYHSALQKAGTQSEIKVYPGMCHPFGHWDGELEMAKEFVRDTIAALKIAYRL
ncbi:MAG: hypothetical protein M1818_008461 [Claussenomyces sp. TS43310]|nr:MAG: hypothetical protein M1818_008461 [Claussenomyces sp. TS43310]